jgi:hypothetical protein
MENKAMTTNLPLAPSHQSNAGRSAVVKINGELVRVHDWTPTARQILAAADLQPATEYALLSWPEHGPTEELGLDETIPLPRNEQVAEFLAMQADGVFYFMLNDERFAWAGPLSAEDVRKVGRVPVTMELWLERRDEPELQLDKGDVVDLLAPGVERIYTRRRKWKLDVHGVIVESSEPQIIVRDALILAGIDPDQGWIIRLKVRGEPKREVGLTDSIDLTKPGIERLQLLSDTINNGEVACSMRRNFVLLAKDETYLDARGLAWETVDDGRRWLLIRDYPVPQGYLQSSTCLAIEIPQNYPAAEIDMFYCNPPLTLESGGQIAQTEHRQVVNGDEFQRWSRHRNPGQWSPVRDSVISHMGLVDESIARELGQ